MVLERLGMDQLKAHKLPMSKMVKQKNLPRSQAGITLVETMMAGAILVIGSLSMIGLIIDSIATNNRNKIDSTQTMLTEAILEQIDSTFIGSGSTDLIDCAGTTWTVSTAVPVSGIAGAALSGAAVDFTQTSPPAGYFMNYVVNNPCTPAGILQGTYDVRWHIDAVGSGVTATNSFLLTVSAKLKSHGEGNKFFSSPVTLRVMAGN